MGFDGIATLSHYRCVGHDVSQAMATIDLGDEVNFQYNEWYSQKKSQNPAPKGNHHQAPRNEEWQVSNDGLFQGAGAAIFQRNNRKTHHFFPQRLTVLYGVGNAQVDEGEQHPHRVKKKGKKCHDEEIDQFGREPKEDGPVETGF